MKAKILYVQHPFTTHREVATISAEELGISEDAPALEWLDRIFRAMNCVDGDPDTEICVRLRVRSMMVGDHVVFEHNDAHFATYACEMVGWKRLGVTSAPPAPATKPRPELTAAQRRLLTAAAAHAVGRVVGGDPRTREKLLGLKLIELDGYNYGPLFKITEAGRAAVAPEA